MPDNTHTQPLPPNRTGALTLCGVAPLQTASSGHGQELSSSGASYPNCAGTRGPKDGKHGPAGIRDSGGEENGPGADEGSAADHTGCT